MKEFYKISIGFLALLLLLGVGGVVYWNSRTYPAGETALGALRTDSEISVVEGPDWIAFQPGNTPPSNDGFVFYPGGGVDFRAYAPVLRMVAERGFLVVLIRVPLNLAFFDVNAADEVISKFPDVDRWAVGGHSLGGVAASSYASSHSESIEGVVLWASYPANDSLRASGVAVASIHGTLDGLATVRDIEASKDLLPEDTDFIPIEGGNHAGFADYGFQEGDNPARITPEEQWRLVAEATVNFLEKLTE